MGGNHLVDDTGALWQEVKCRQAVSLPCQKTDTFSIALRIGLMGIGTTFAALLVLRLIIWLLARFTAQPANNRSLPVTARNEAASDSIAADIITQDTAAIMAVVYAMGVIPQTGGQIRIEKIPG